MMQFFGGASITADITESRNGKFTFLGNKVEGMYILLIPLRILKNVLLTVTNTFSKEKLKDSPV